MEPETSRMRTRGRTLRLRVRQNSSDGSPCWRIVARNWHGGGGELDIVASRWRTLLVVEVRHRSAGAPLASIDRGKLERTLAAAHALVAAHGLQRYRLRIDVIGLDASGRLVHRCDVLHAALPAN